MNNNRQNNFAFHHLYTMDDLVPPIPPYYIYPRQHSFFNFPRLKTSAIAGYLYKMCEKFTKTK